MGASAGRLCAGDGVGDGDGGVTIPVDPKKLERAASLTNLVCPVSVSTKTLTLDVKLAPKSSAICPMTLPSIFTGIVFN